MPNLGTQLGVPHTRLPYIHPISLWITISLHLGPPDNHSSGVCVFEKERETPSSPISTSALRVNPQPSQPASLSSYTAPLVSWNTLITFQLQHWYFSENTGGIDILNPHWLCWALTVEEWKHRCWEQELSEWPSKQKTPLNSNSTLSDGITTCAVFRFPAGLQHCWSITMPNLAVSNQL